MTIYRGYRLEDGTAVVMKCSGPPTRRHRLSTMIGWVNHSPTGFEWGYAGSGPAQLALALLADALGKAQKERAIALHQRFKSHVVVRLERDKPWEMTDTMVANIADELEAPARP